MKHLTMANMGRMGTTRASDIEIRVPGFVSETPVKRYETGNHDLTITILDF